MTRLLLLAVPALVVVACGGGAPKRVELPTDPPAPATATPDGYGAVQAIKADCATNDSLHIALFCDDVMSGGIFDLPAGVACDNALAWSKRYAAIEEGGQDIDYASALQLADAAVYLCDLALAELQTPPPY